MDGPSQIRHLADTTSTNDYLARLWTAEAAAPYSVVMTDFQSAGRGRLTREWIAPPGTSLLMSVLVPATSSTLTWVPLAAGVAVARALDTLIPATSVAVKWPNDILLNGAKAAGVLAEHLGSRDGREWIALGIGVNLTQTRDQLPPVPSTSVALEGGPAIVHPTSLAAQIVAAIRAIVSPLSAADDATDLLDVLRLTYVDHCVSVGSEVEVVLPSGASIHGRGVDVAADGALIVEDDGGTRHGVRAGDVALVTPVAVAQSPTTHTPMSGAIR